MMLGTGATCETLRTVICITPFRAWRDGPFSGTARLHDAPNHARQLDDASTNFDVLEKSSPVKLVNYSRSWW
jgi:hypothetical protein